jgi:hypothetical protein
MYRSLSATAALGETEVLEFLMSELEDSLTR